MKTCTKCNTDKPDTEFYVHAKGKRPGLMSAACKTCEAARMKKYYVANTGKKKAWFDQRYRRLKDEVFEAYGGYRCACCGETESAFLDVHHLDGKGAERRREINPNDYRSASGYATYRWLVSNGFPPGFQVLCANCNHGRFRNGGVCPHQQLRSEGSTTIPKGSTPQAVAEVRSPCVALAG